MTRRTMTLAAALAVALAATATGATAFAQDPATDEQIVVDPDVQYWIDSLTQHLGNENPAIRKSAYSALLTLGKQALPTLRHLAETADEETAKTARKLAGHIKKSQAMAASKKKRYASKRPLAGAGLSDGQEAQVKAIRKAHHEESRQLKEQVKTGEITEAQAKAAWREMEADMKEQIKALLTPEQLEKLERARENRRAIDRKNHDRRPGARGAMGDRLAKHLELTGAQQAQVKEIHKAHGERMKDLMQAVRDGSLDREAAAKSREQYQDELKIEMQGVLTPEQFEKFEKGMMRRQDHEGRRGRGRAGAGAGAGARGRSGRFGPGEGRLGRPERDGRGERGERRKRGAEGEGNSRSF